MDMRYRPVINYCIIICIIMIMNYILHIISYIFFRDSLLYSIMKYIGILNLFYGINILLISFTLNVQYVKSKKIIDKLLDCIDLISDDKEVNLDEIESKFSKEN